MSSNGKPRRRYHSARRALAAFETRQAILDAAAGLFIADGWAKTTMAAIGRRAGVSIETVYAVFGNKRTMVKELVGRAVRGEAPDVPLLEQAGPQAMRNEANQRRQIALFAHGIAAVLQRVGPLMAAVQAGAGSYPELAELYRHFHDGRRRNLAFVADALLANGPLREGIDRDQAVVILWRLASPEQFILTTRVEGLSSDQYERWLSESLARLLLP